ncbi:MAG: hypothetical protein MUC91_10770 [Verrucomicrobia bacterium]|nr:hypothetical protein [Verrucomicrobiota bacterium]
MQCVQKVQDWPCLVQIVRKPELRLELVALLSPSLFGCGALLDHRHSARRNPEQPCDLLACYSLRTHLNDPSVTLAGCRHGAETKTDSFTWSARGHPVANEN